MTIAELERALNDARGEAAHGHAWAEEYAGFLDEATRALARIRDHKSASAAVKRMATKAIDRARRDP